MNPQLDQKILKCKLCESLGINFEKEREENLRYAYDYKPDKVKILWIVESPPSQIHRDISIDQNYPDLIASSEKR